MLHKAFEIGLASSPTGGCLLTIGPFVTEAGANSAVKRRMQPGDLWVVGESEKLTRATQGHHHEPLSFADRIDDEYFRMSPEQQEEAKKRLQLTTSI